jgi:hypothetical protein
VAGGAVASASAASSTGSAMANQPDIKLDLRTLMMTEDRPGLPVETPTTSAVMI